MFEENDNAGIGIIVWNSYGEVMGRLFPKKFLNLHRWKCWRYLMQCGLSNLFRKQVCSCRTLTLKATLFLVSKPCKEEICICYCPLFGHLIFDILSFPWLVKKFLFLSYFEVRKCGFTCLNLFREQNLFFFYLFRWSLFHLIQINKVVFADFPAHK